MAQRAAYQAKQLELSGLNGSSQQSLAMRFKLYAGYVKATNTRNEQTWIELHKINYVAGFKTILPMGVREHAYLLDYQLADRPLYLAACCANLAWPQAAQRLNKGKAAQAHTRV